jgi:hypothetical protein
MQFSRCMAGLTREHFVDITSGLPDPDDNGLRRSDHEELFQTLLRSNEAAFASGRYEAAYHALMAALHVAQDSEDAEGLLVIVGRAKEQQAAIDAVAHDHRFSTASAANRGHKSLYEMAVQQARAQAAMIRLRRSESDL